MKGQNKKKNKDNWRTNGIRKLLCAYPFSTMYNANMNSKMT